MGTKLRDKAADKDSLIAFVVPSAFVAVADSFSESLHKHAGELVFFHTCFVLCNFLLPY